MQKKYDFDEIIDRLTVYPESEEETVLFWEAVEIAKKSLRAWEKVKLDIYEQTSEEDGLFGYGFYLDLINKRLGEIYSKGEKE